MDVFPSSHCCGARQESVGTQGIGIGGGTGAPPSTFKTGLAKVEATCAHARGTKLPRIVRDISQISFLVFMVTPFLN